MQTQWMSSVPVRSLLMQPGNQAVRNPCTTECGRCHVAGFCCIPARSTASNCNLHITLISSCNSLNIHKVSNCLPPSIGQSLMLIGQLALSCATGIFFSIPPTPFWDRQALIWPRTACRARSCESLTLPLLPTW